MNVSNTSNGHREYPQWHAQGKLKKADAAGNILEGQYACNGEIVAISPRYQKNGVNYRVRPERPAAFFAAFLFEHGLLPELLTPEESTQNWALELMEPLWERFKTRFPLLGSPFAASDILTVPSLRVGYSFNIAQVLIEHIGSLKPTSGRPSTYITTNGNGHSNPVDLEAARRTILAMRARSHSVPATKPEALDELKAMFAQEDDPSEETPPTGEPEQPEQLTSPSRRGRRHQS